jgi:hypothetical protein
MFRMVAACSANPANVGKSSADCEKFLSANERARMQWKLEREFANFEKKY